MNPFETITELKDYQRQAFAKAAASRVSGLFMDMGTGKSRVTIELANYRQNRISNVIWFCPVSMVREGKIESEILKHTTTPETRIYTFDNKTREGLIPQVDWYIIGIESMSSSGRLKFAASSIIDENSMVVVDESEFIKGHRSNRTEWITRISERCKYRLILTGTPVSQGPEDLYAQMRFLSPKVLGYNSWYSFAANHLEYSKKYPGRIVRAHNTEWLAAKIQPYIYQITKEEALADLPGKRYETIRVSLSPEQWKEYELAKTETFEKADSMEQWDSVGLIFSLFTKLQQITSGFIPYDDHGIRAIHEMDECRTEALGNIIGSLPGTEKIVIFAKFRYDMAHIAKFLREKYGDDSVMEFHGGVNLKTRRTGLKHWKTATECRFLIATSGVAGHGFDMVEAATVIFYNNGFKFSQRIQSEDRLRRLDQTREVNIFDIRAVCGIEDIIMDALWKKENGLTSFREEIDKIKNKGQLKRLLEAM